MDVPRATFIQGATSIPDSSVRGTAFNPRNGLLLFHGQHSVKIAIQLYSKVEY